MDRTAFRGSTKARRILNSAGEDYARVKRYYIPRPKPRSQDFAAERSGSCAVARPESGQHSRRWQMSLHAKSIDWSLILQFFRRCDSFVAHSIPLPSLIYLSSRKLFPQQRDQEICPFGQLTGERALVLAGFLPNHGDTEANYFKRLSVPETQSLRIAL